MYVVYIIGNDLQGNIVLVVLNFQPLYDHVMINDTLVDSLLCYQPKPSTQEQEVSLSSSPTIK